MEQRRMEQGSLERIHGLSLGLIRSLKDRLIAQCGEDFVSLVVFGSFVRQDFGLNSDIDLLLIFQQFPDSTSRARMHLFLGIEAGIESEKIRIWENTGYYPHFSPILRTMKEAKRFSRLYLDMTEHVLVIYDRDRFFAHLLTQIKHFLNVIDAQKRWIGNKWYWVFAPDIEIGEVLPDG